MSAGSSLGQAILELRVEDSQLRAGLQNARAQAQAVTGQFSSTEQSAVRTGGAFNVMGSAAQSAGGQLQSAGGMVGGLSSGLVDVQGRALSSKTALDAVGQGAMSAGKQAQGAVGSVSGLGTAFSTTNLKAVAASAGVVGATVAIGQGLVTAARAGVQWESAFAGVAKTVDATEAELATLSSGIRQMATEIPIAATELAGIAEAAGALGVAKGDILAFTETAALIGVTTDVSSDQAATALGQLSNVLGLTADDYERFGSTLVDLGNQGASTESAILGIATRSGAASELIGMATDETLAWAASVANLGIETEAAGSSLQVFFVSAAKMVSEAGSELDILAETAGMTADAFSQLFAEDSSAALQAFITGLGDLDQAQQLATLSALGFNDVRITRTLLGLASNTDNLTASLKISEGAWRDNTAMAAEAEKRFETSASELQILENRAIDAAIATSQELNPSLDAFIDIGGDAVSIMESLGSALDLIGAPTALNRLAEDAALLTSRLARVLELTTDFSARQDFGTPEVDDGWSDRLVRGLVSGDVIGAFTDAGRQSSDAFWAAFTDAERVAVKAGLEEMVSGLFSIDNFVADQSAIRDELQRTGQGFTEFGVAGELVGERFNLAAARIRDDLQSTGQGFNEFGTQSEIALGQVGVNSEQLQAAFAGSADSVVGNLGLISQAAASGALDFDAAMQLFARVPRDQLVPAVAQAAAEIRGKLAEAILTGEDTRQLEGQLEALRIMFPELVAEINGTAVALGNFGAIQDIFQQNITNAGAGVSEWQDHLSGAETALGFLQEKIDAGIPLTEKEASNYDILTGAVARYTGGIQDESVALIDAEVAKAEFIAQQDILNGKLADGSITQDEYNRAISAAAAAIDPATAASMGLTGAQGDLVTAVDGVVSRIRDLLVELGLIPSEKTTEINVPGALNARDAVIGVNDQLNLFPPSKESELRVRTEQALSAARELVSTLGEIPPSTVSDITSNVGEVTPQIANHGGILEGLPGETPTMITTNAVEASGEISGVSQTIDEVPKETNLSFIAAVQGAIGDTQNLTSTINDVPKENTSSFIANVQGAIGGAQELTRNIDAVPDENTTTLYANDQASGPISTVQGALNGLPTSFTVYINADAAGFYAAVQGVDNYIPRSPAKEGPFSEPANWSWIFEGLAPAAGNAAGEMGTELEQVDLTSIGERQMQTWASGIESGSTEVAGAAGAVAGDVNTAVVESLGGGRQFQADTFLSEVSQLSEFILATVIESATQFEAELVDAAKGYVDAVTSSVDMFTSALALLKLLGESNPNAAVARTAIEELNLFTRHIIESVSASAEMVGGGGEDGLLARTQEYVTGTQAGVDLLTSGAELFATLSTLTGNLDTAKQAASNIKFLTEHIVLSVGDSAVLVSETRPDGFTAMASAYATGAKVGIELMSAGADVMSKLSELTGNLDRAKMAATDVKFLTEHIVLSIGDSAAFIAAERGDGFVAQAGIYAEASLTAVELINAAATTMAELELVRIDLGRAKDAASQMKFLTEHIVQSIGDSAALFTVEGLTHIQAYADAALAGQGIMQGVAPTLESMLAFGALDSSGIDLNIRAIEMADLTRMIVAALQDASTYFQADGLTAVTNFSTAAQSALDLMGGVGAALESILLFASVDTTDRDLEAISQNMVALIETIVQQIQLVAVHFQTAGLEAVTNFSTAALNGLEVMGAAGDALAAILMFGALSPEERDGLKYLAFEMTGVMDYIIAMIRDMSTQYSTEGIEHLSSFATAAKQSLDLVGAAQTAFKGMVDHSRVTQEHADAFLSSWTIVIELVKDVADLVSNQGVQDALRFLTAAEEIAALMTAANTAIGSVAPQPLPSTGASSATTKDIAPVTSPSSGAASTTNKGAFQKVYGMSKADYFAQPGMAFGGVTDRETLVRISEGNQREGIIPLESGGAGIVAKALVDQMRAAPEWAAMTSGSLPSAAAMNPWSSRQAVSDIDFNFNGPVTINARDRADAERSLGDIAWGLKAARRKRGMPL